MKATIIAAITLLLSASFVDAGAQTIKGKAVQQHRRIKQGVRSGEITRAEAVNLRNGQREIRQDVRAAKADGVVTAAEKSAIKQEQRQESRKIFRKKHNNRDRN